MDQQKINNETPLGYQYSLEITARTPMHIGCGESFSPLTDYIIEGRKIRFIDSTKFSQILYEKNLTEDFIASVKKNMNLQKFNFLKDFIINRLKVSIDDVCQELAYPVYLSGNPVEMHRFVSTGGNVFIPGSTIKGALRSALLYKWMLNPANAYALDEWVKNLRWIYPKNNEKLSYHQIEEKHTELEKCFANLIEEKCFGVLNPKGINRDTAERLAMSCLKLGDSNNIALDEMAAYEICRFRLDEEKEDIRVLKECVDADNKCKAKLSIDFSSLFGGMKKYPKILQEFCTWEQICKTINAYSKDVLDYEINVLSYEAFNNDDLDKYQGHLTALSEEIENSTDVAYLRLGQGKMQFYQTIALVLFKSRGEDEDNDDWIKYLNYCAGFPDDGLKEIYPITRSLATIDQIPLGWVMIKLL